jgi:GT2 family glycosyltransferase
MPVRRPSPRLQEGLARVVGAIRPSPFCYEGQGEGPMSSPDDWRQEVTRTAEGDTELTPLASVVVPTHDRPQSLLRLLRALERQTCGPNAFEVIVVVDGASEATLALLASECFELRLRWLAQPQSGVAVTRNRGAAEAAAPLLIFLDDDVEPGAGLVAAQIELQGREGPCVAFGRLAQDPNSRPPGWWRWFEWQLQKQYAEMHEGRRPVDGRSLYSGNFALPRDLFLAAGGFDASLQTCEDTDLGIRLQRAGAGFRLNDEAIGYHGGYHDFAAWKQTAYRDGYWDAGLALKMNSPFRWMDLLADFRGRDPRLQRAARLLLGRDLSFQAAIASLRLTAALAGGLRLRRAELEAYAGMYSLIYWQGVCDAIGGAGLLRRYLDAPGPIEVAA